METPNIAEMSGQDTYRGAGFFNLNEIKLNGKSGHYIYKNKLGEKGEDGKYPTEDLGNKLDVVFLIIRRKLFQYRKDVRSLETNEHRDKDDVVMLYGENEKGKASDLRKKYQGLRTHQIVYCFLPSKKEVVRLIVKGSSLGSDNKNKENLSFYDYISSFPRTEHMYEYFTSVSSITETGKLGEYFTMAFQKGKRLSDEQQGKVNVMIANTFSKVAEIESFYNSKTAQEVVAEVDPVNDTDYPDEDINPEDIPF